MLIKLININISDLMQNFKQLYFDMPSKTSFDLENYMVSNSNNFAFDMIVKMLKNKIEVGVITGPAFSGKTHLSRILLNNIENNNALYFDRDYQNLTSKIETSKLLIIENIDKVMKDNAEEQLFHIINSVKENKKKLLMTSRKPISEIKIQLEDLKSRLNSILEAKINQPDDELVRLILIKIFNDKQLKVNPDVVNYLLQRIDRSYESINNFIKKIDEFSLEKGRKITVNLVSGFFN